MGYPHLEARRQESTPSETVEVAGPLGTPLGLAQRKRASPRGEAGTSGFLCVSDSDRRVPAELGQESQASSCLRKGTPLASRVAQGVSGPPSSCVCKTARNVVSLGFRIVPGIQKGLYNYLLNE